jgi:hypothetical protein
VFSFYSIFLFLSLPPFAPSKETKKDEVKTEAKESKKGDAKKEPKAKKETEKKGKDDKSKSATASAEKQGEESEAKTEVAAAPKAEPKDRISISKRHKFPSVCWASAASLSILFLFPHPPRVEYNMLILSAFPFFIRSIARRSRPQSNGSCPTLPLYKNANKNIQIFILPLQLYALFLSFFLLPLFPVFLLAISCQHCFCLFVLFFSYPLTVCVC